MKETYSFLLSPKALGAMEAKMAWRELAAELSDRCQGVSFLGQPLRLTGARATLETQVGTFILLVQLAKLSGWAWPQRPQGGPGWRLAAPDTRGLAEALRHAFSLAPVGLTDVKAGLDDFLAACDGGEIQIELMPEGHRDNMGGLSDGAARWSRFLEIQWPQ